MYADDTGFYPIAERFINQYGSPWPGYWFETLEPYVHAGWTNQLYRCPSYRLRTAPRPPYANDPALGPFGSYGYNGSRYAPLGAWSLGWPSNPIAWQLNSPASGPGVKQAAVRAPVEMLELGDSQIFAISSANLVGSDELFFGGWGYEGYGPEPQDAQNKIIESNRRHNGKFNLVFCDGHLERIPISRLFDVADPAIRRRWCYDNEPHFP
jgi:prepilin-type processing-associated H-X9-DG protein